MFTRIAVVVEDNIVTNRILVNVDENGHHDFEIPDQMIILVSDDSPASIGWILEDGEFHEPEV